MLRGVAEGRRPDCARRRLPGMRATLRPGGGCAMIRRWLPQKGAKVWGIPERYGFAIVIVALLVVAVFLIR